MEHKNKLIAFLKQFNKISITLDLSAPVKTFIKELKKLVDFIKNFNANFFNHLGVHLDLVLMITEFKKEDVLLDEVRILTNKD